MKKMILAAALGLLTFLSPFAGQAQSIRVDGSSFKDPEGRTLMLRGVNLGGTSRVPAVTSSDPRAVSYVGRPFPLEVADEHFSRLKSWGLTVERLIVPWEAIEHAGPGQYDQAYLDYLYAVISRARDHGIKVYIDPHADYWSRAFGGNGAPYWTLEAIGLGIDQTAESGVERSENNPANNVWPPSGGRHGIETMWTLFWAGNDFAPRLKVDRVPVQEYLQSHFINAIAQVALRLRGLDNVIGYDLWNEPMQGYLGVSDLRSPELLMLLLGKLRAPNAPAPTYWDYMQAASGYEPGEGSLVKVVPMWSAKHKDLWRKYGVWDVVDGKPVLKRPDYFATVKGKPADFNAYLKAFQLRYIKAIREIAPTALFMQELNIVGGPTRTKDMELGLPGIINEPHFYDAKILATKLYTPDITTDFMGNTYTGRNAIMAFYAKSLQGFQAESKALGGIPTLFGEAGLRFDLNNDEAFKTGDFRAQEAHARILFDALDQTLASYTIWNYSADNTNARGDLWNTEDFSIYSLSQRTHTEDINSGGRALHQIVRPYPMATAGTPVALSFDTKRRIFDYRFRADPGVKAETEIFVPRLQYPNGFKVSVHGGSFRADPAQSRVMITGAAGEVTVVIKPH